MARPTPAVFRAASVLNLLAAHPSQSFTLSEILRSLEMNRATLHSILLALVEVGYLHRSREKTYTLGPSLVDIAYSARDYVSPLRIAMPEMHDLARRFDAVCSACFREGDEIVVRERTASSSHISWIRAPNSRFPLRPPLGTVFMAWAPPVEVEKWLSRVLPDEPVREEGALAYPRRNGFACGLRRHTLTGPFDIAGSHSRIDDTEFAIDRLDPDQEYALSFLAAPIFDSSSEVAFVLVLTGLQVMSGADVEQTGRILRASCDQISAATSGKPPLTGA